MGQYLEPIHVAIIVFPLLAIGMAFPLLVYHYARYGAVSAWQVFVNYSFYFYLLCAYFLIILPLPTRAADAALTTPTINLHPLLVYYNFRATGFSLHQPGTWLATLHAPGFQQPFFNIVLTIPFGFYLHYYFKRGVLTSVMLSFGLSLFFELTQLSGLYGFYVRPYRLFDVDDLLLNTTGGLVGWLLAPLFTWLLPTQAQIAATNRRHAVQVGLMRRLTAFVFDWLLIGIGIVIVTLVMRVFNDGLPGWLLSTVGVLGLIWLPEQLFHGQTIGLRAVHLQIRSLKWQTPQPWQIAVRNLVCYIPLIGLIALAQPWFSRSAHPSELFLAGVIILALMFDGLLAVLLPRYPLLFERLSQTTTVSSYRPAANQLHQTRIERH